MKFLAVTACPSGVAHTYMAAESSENIESKKAIAKKAYDVIKEHETIFLDISSTNIHLAHEIANGNKEITVITNMIDVVQTFLPIGHINVIGIGGIYNNKLNGFIGSITIDSICQFKVDRAFIGTCGIDLSDQSIATFLIDDGSTKSAIIKASRKNYVVADKSIFYQDGTYKFAKLADIDAIILNSYPSTSIIKTLDEFSIELI